MVALSALLIPIGLLASARAREAEVVHGLDAAARDVGDRRVPRRSTRSLFFIFFEFVLVPMYFLIAGWGHDNRRYAAMKFFLFTLAGSAFLFVGILSVAFLHQHATGQPLTFDVRVLTDWASSSSIHGSAAKWLFVAFAIGFAVKVPLFPFHTWLPDAHTDAPTAGSVVLAGVMLKMGTYGFLRFAMPFFPQAAVDLAPVLLMRRGDRHHLRRDRRGDAAEPETDHRVLVGRAPRVRRARHLCVHTAGHHRRTVHDALARSHDRCPLPAGRHALRPAPHV